MKKYRILKTCMSETEVLSTHDSFEAAYKHIKLFDTEKTDMLIAGEHVSIEDNQSSTVWEIQIQDI